MEVEKNLTHSRANELGSLPCNDTGSAPQVKMKSQRV